MLQRYLQVKSKITTCFCLLLFPQQVKIGLYSYASNFYMILSLDILISYLFPFKIIVW